ncbi:glycosyltransferase family 87 protein [Pseudofrankia inefficax]|uniref:Putative transmembrane protein n=1 Tax=Pseudofrankia inefficax (strain DSM 45817 / CECT 9037 / DDB 130130 / EuI1c) TaxID=298654 RepID=E3IZU1_PSEI1|nr:glycosyltransferase 87 family protein [Pseudofrankia inefficax]ADP85133.1 putative transmembrane protein [Pseudofrankia inefficax]
MTAADVVDATVSPSDEDPVVRGASELVGGPPGRHAALPASTWWTPLRVLLALTIVVCGLGYTQKATCRDTRNWAHEYQYTRMCYSDVVALYSQEGLSGGKTPYLDYPTEYPPLIGLTMEVVGAVSRLAPTQHPVYKTVNGQQVVDHYTMDSRSALFYDLTWVLFLGLACVTVVATALTAGRRRIWDAALFALAPTMVLHLLTNWDIIAVAFAALAIYAWSRRMPVVAGVMLGLGVCTKLYPIFFLVGLFVLCLRTGYLRTFARTAIATAATIVAIMLPTWLVAGYFVGTQKVQDGILPTFFSGGDWLSLLGGHGPDGSRNAVEQFFHLNETRVADWDSVAFALQWLSGAHDPGWFAGLHLVVVLLSGLLLAGAVVLVRYRAERARWAAGPEEPERAQGLLDAPRVQVAVAGGTWLVIVIATPLVLTAIREHGVPVHVLNWVTAVVLLMVVAAICALCWFAPRRPRLPQVLFLLVVAFLVTNKVFSPQYTLWLVPLYALARPKWRAFLVWQATEAYLLFMRFMHFIYNDTSGGRGVARGWFVGAVALRDLMLVVLAGLVVREILRPELDVVRASGLDDPAGGVLDGAADAAVGRGRAVRRDYAPSERPPSERPPAPEPSPTVPEYAETGPLPSLGRRWRRAEAVGDTGATQTGTGTSGRGGETGGDGGLSEPGALFKPRRTDPDAP